MFGRSAGLGVHALSPLIYLPHRLNMKLDLQSLFGLLCAAVLIGRDPATPPPPIWAQYTSALLVSKDRRHLFVTPFLIFFLCLGGGGGSYGSYA